VPPVGAENHSFHTKRWGVKKTKGQVVILLPICALILAVPELSPFDMYFISFSCTIVQH